MSKEYAPVILGGLGTVATELTRALILSGVKINVITKSTSHSTRYKRNKTNAILRIPLNTVGRAVVGKRV
jgi:glycogen(starch) synthase